MPSFVSILKKIGGVALQVEHLAEPVIKTLLPQSAGVFAILDPLFASIPLSIANNELGNPVDHQGSLKEPQTIADFEAGLQATQAILAATGKRLAWDDQKLKLNIAQWVAAYNGSAELRASFHLVDIPKT